MHGFSVVLLLSLSISPAFAIQRLDDKAVEAATFSGKVPARDQTSPLLIKLEVLLDRAHFSPGEIDGKLGENVTKSLAAYADEHGLATGPAITTDIVSSLLGDRRPVLTQYVLTENDVKGPFTKNIPAKLEEMKSLKKVGYRSVKEAIAEKFHVSESLLVVLNPRISINRVGQQIIVPNILIDEGKGQHVTRVEVNKSQQTVKAYSKSGELVAFYPATVGSEEKPSPVGTFKIISIDRNPTYRYNPKYHFKGVKSKKPFVIGPGPNNPVGIEWIGLSADGYGIHGTPDPSRVSKSASHGCVRLTNWDAAALASMVTKGIQVQFVSVDSNEASTPSQ